MKYYKNEIFEELNSGSEKGQNDYKEAYMAYKKANKKAMKKVPESFITVYENTGFHDAIILEININTQYQGFNRNEHGNRTFLQLVVMKYNEERQRWQGWDIALEELKNLKITAESEGKSFTCIDTFHHDELLLTSDKYLSWEINAINTNIKTEFKTLNICELSKLEVERYKSIR